MFCENKWSDMPNEQKIYVIYWLLIIVHAINDSFVPSDSSHFQFVIFLFL